MKLSEIMDAYRHHFDNGYLPFILCQSCGYIFYYYRDFCPKCMSKSIALGKSIGRGKVFAVTRVRRRSGEKVAYGIVQLQEGFRIYCNLDEDQAEAQIGDPVLIVFKAIDGKKYPYGKIERTSSECKTSTQI